MSQRERAEMTKPNPTTRLSSRRNWLRSSSMIAAAAALAAGASMPAYAQARPGLSGTGLEITMQDRLQMRGNARAEMGRDILSEIPSIRRQPQPAPTPITPILSNAQTNNVAAPNPSPVMVQRAPNVPSVPITPTLPAPPVPAPGVPSVPAPGTPQQTQSVASTITPFALIPEPGIAGINVSANARYDDVEIEFNPGVAVDQVNVLASSAIIDWTTFDPGASGAEITFLGDGRNLEFTSSLSDYTVLNRVLTPGFDSAIRIDGNVTSTILDGSSIGGNVWFYSAGGIVVGSTATFNIGSLLLSTSLIDPSSVSSGGADLNFSGSPVDSAIRIENGATIQANNNNSYVALVAPRIEQLGTVAVNGSVAYVAAEEAEMTIRNNLFDITVNVGSEDDNGIVHTGNTTGVASTDITDEQAIYFVAVPKNDAITMLVGGSIGYTPAANAFDDNGQIILTTGPRVERTERDVLIRNSNGSSSLVEVSSNTVDTTVDGNQAGSIILEDVTFRSDVTAFAEESLTLQAGATTASGAIIARGLSGDRVDLDLTAGQRIDLSVTRQGRIDIGGSLTLTSGDGNGTGGDIAVAIGQTAVSASGFDALNIDDTLTLNAQARGRDDVVNFRNNGGNGIGEDAFAGDVTFDVIEDASVSISNGLNIDTSATGGRGEILSGSASAGSVDLSLSGISFSVGGTVDIDANAESAGTLVASGSAAREGSDSSSSDVTINLLDGSVDWGRLEVAMGARASSGTDNTIIQSNDSTVGRFTLNATAGFHTISSLFVTAESDAANAFDGRPDEIDGIANRGTASIAVSNFDTGLDISDSVTVTFNTDGETTAPVGDTISVSVTDTGFGTGSGLTVGGSVRLNANHSDGNVGSVQQGGTISVVADNALLSLNSLFLTSDAQANEFSFTEFSATELIGGDVSLTATNSAIVNVDGFSVFSANGSGAVNNSGNDIGRGQGGTIVVLADDASLSFNDSLFLGADGFALSGSNDDGLVASGIGGTVRIIVQGASGNLSFADLEAGTDGTFAFDGEVFNSFFEGNGSAGVGGLTEFNILGGTLTAQDIVVSSSGFGGPAGEIPVGDLNPANGLSNVGSGGDGVGGEVTFNIDGGDATIVNLTVASDGIGGRGATGRIDDDTNAGDGGDGTGGTATLNAISGSLTVINTLSVEALGNDPGFGGEGGFARGTIGGDGGSSTGGNAVFNLDGTATINADTVVVSTEAFGGDGGSSRESFNGDPDQGGGAGGDGIGGNAVFNDIAGNLSFNSLTVDSSGNGGEGGDSTGASTSSAAANGGAGGNGTGGTALIALGQDDTVTKDYSVIAQGNGGDGGTGNMGGRGGSGSAGIAQLLVDNVSVVFGDLVIDATATGGDASFNDGIGINDGSEGGDALGGDASLVVTGADGNFVANSVISIVAGATGGIAASGSSSSIDAVAGGLGGSGGSGTGGSATISVQDNASIILNADTISINADSFGGAAGNGGGNFGGGSGGDGGNGGDGTGGIVGIVAVGGADIEVQEGADPFELSSSGTGGAGGTGGGVNTVNGAGNGGDGGTGTGGSPTLSASGATITIQEITLTAQGFGATAGGAGFNNPIAVGNAEAGVGGGGNGGTPLIEAVEGSPGIINLGDTTIIANGTSGPGLTNGVGSGGQVTIRDVSTDPDGLISFGNLIIDATGDPGTDAGRINFSSDSGPITVDGNLVAASAGNMSFSMSGDGQLVVTGSAVLTASNVITVRRLDQTSTLDAIDLQGSFTSVVNGGRFIALNDGDINAGGPVSITADEISYDSIFSPSTVTLIATAGDIVGASTGTITASAVNDAINLTATGNVIFGTLNNVDGDPVTRDGNIDIDAGGDIIGVSAISGQTIDFDAGGLVMVETVDTSETSVGTVTINAGEIDLGTLNARFISNLTSTTGDIAIDTISSLTNVGLDSAADVIIGTAETSSISVDALAGDITIGSLTTTGAVADVRLNAGGDVGYTNIDSSRLVTIDGDTITGGDLVATAGVTLEAGSIDIGDTRSTGGFILLTSTAGDITTGAITLDQFGTTVDSAGAVSLGDITSVGTARINSVDDATVGDIIAINTAVIDAGGNIVTGDLLTGGVSITGAGDADIANAVTGGSINIAVDGALSGGEFAGEGPLSLVTLNAASVDIDSAQSVSQTLTITTSGAAVIGSASSGVNTTINGASVTLDSGDVGLDLRVTSSVGDITGLGSITVGRAANFNSAADIAIGTLEANSISLTSAGDLRFNGLISPNAITLSAVTGTIGATTPGLGDIDSGGAVDLTAEAIDLGDVDSDTSITAFASVGDASFGDLTAGTFISIDAQLNPIVRSVTSGGNVDLTGASISLDGGDVGGNLTLDARSGDINLAFDGTDQLLVGGSASFTAPGDMSVTHTNNAAGTTSVDVGLSTRVDIGGSFTSGVGSIIDSTGELLIFASGDITADDLRTEPGVVLSAGGDVLLNNATATGPQGVSNFRGIVVEAGFEDFGSISGFNPGSNATITGDVTSYADIRVTAGSTAIFASGSTTAADNALIVNTGDDIIVEAGAILSAANNPTDQLNPADPFQFGPNLTLNAGGEENLLSLPGTPIASLVIDGTLDANAAAIVLTGNAIEGLDSTLIAGSISADIVDAPASAASLSTDDDLLSGVCVEGIVCLGDMDATNRIEIGQNSNNDVIQLFIEQAVISATDILITTRNDIVMGTNGIDTTLDASGTFSATSNTGNVELNDAAISANQILLSAANSVIGTGVLTSANDIGIDVGSSISVGGIITGGELTTVAEVGGPIEGFYTIAGDFTAEIFSQGSSSIDLNTGGSIDIGQGDSPDSILLTADGDAFLGLASVPGDIQIDAGSVGFDTLDAGGVIFLSANGGSITASQFSSAVAGTDIDLLADGDIAVGDLDAGNSVSADGASIAVGSVFGSSITLTSASDILFDLLDSGSAITLGASNGVIAANFADGDIVSAGGVTLDAEEIAIGDVSANGAVNAAATAGTASFGDVSTTALGSAINLSAAGASSNIQAATLTTNSGDILISAAQDIALTGGATSAGTPTAGSIGLLAGGNVSATGALSAGEDVAIRALGNATLGTVTAGDDVTVDADGSISLDSATANAGGIDLFSIVFDEANAGQTGTILFASEASAGSNITLTSGTDVTATGTLNADNAITVTATGTPSVNNAISGGDTSITGSSVTFNSGMVGGDLTLNAAAGDIDGNGAVSVAGAIDFDASGNVGFGALNAQGGSFTVDAGGDVAFTSATSTDFITMNAGGAVQGGDLNATNALNVTADNIALGDVIADQISLTSATDILFNLIQSPNAISLSAVNGLIGQNTGPGDIETDDDVTLLAEFINVGQIDAGGDVTATATGTPDAGGMGGNSGPVMVGGGAGLDVALTTANITSGGVVDLTAVNGPVRTGDVDAASNLSIEGAGITTGDLIARAVFDAGVMQLTSTGDLSIGTASSVGRFTATADGDVDFVSITNTRNSASIVADGSISGGAIAVTQQSTGGTAGSNLISLTAGGDITLSGDASAQSGVSLIAGGAITAQNITATIAGGNVTARGGGAVSVGNVSGGSSNSTQVQGTSVSTGSVTGGGITLRATDGSVVAGGAVTGAEATRLFATQDIDAGDVEGGNTLTLSADGNVSFADIAAVIGDLIVTAGGDITGNSANRQSTIVSGIGLRLDADGDVDVATITSATSANVSGVAINFDTANTQTSFDAAGDTIDFGTVGAGTDATLIADNGDLTGSVEAGGTADITASNGSIEMANLTAMDADLLASGAIEVGDADVIALLDAEGTSIDIASSSGLVVDVTATDGAISVVTDGDLDVLSASATENVTLASMNGATAVTQASGDDITLTAEGRVTITDTVDAVGALIIDAGAAARIEGIAIGETISVAAANVDIFADGQLGDATRTSTIEFETFRDVVVGGAGTDNEGGLGAFFEVDNTEFERIHSGGDIQFTALSDGSSLDGLITVNTLDLIAGDGSSATEQNIGQAGALILQSEGDIEIRGDATINGSTFETGFVADALNLVRLDTANGGIFLIDANESISGAVEIFATDFIAATDTAFNDIQGLSVADVDLRLENSDGVDRPDGVIRADTLIIETIASQVFIQNTVPGLDFDQRRGFNVNAISISTAGSTVQPIVINGTVAGVTGIDAIALIDLGSAFAAGSTINGCLIANPASCAPVTVTPGPTPTDPDSGEIGTGGSEVEIRDLIEEELGDEGGLVAGLVEGNLITINPDNEFNDDPLIDDPVTGAGNEDLWVSDEEEEDEEEGGDE